MVPPEHLLLPGMASQLAVALLVLGSDGSTAALWAGTGALAVGFCAIYSNVLSLLASYDLNTPLAVSLLQLACGVGTMSVPKAVGLVHHHSSLGHDALFVVLGVTTSACLVVVSAVVLHLRRNFTPAYGSIHARRLEAGRGKQMGAVDRTV